jgi:hypothetical protein
MIYNQQVQRSFTQKPINTANIHQMLALNFILKNMETEFMCFNYYLQDGSISYEQPSSNWQLCSVQCMTLHAENVTI